MLILPFSSASMAARGQTDHISSVLPFTLLSPIITQDHPHHENHGMAITKGLKIFAQDQFTEAGEDTTVNPLSTPSPCHIPNLPRSF